MNYKTFRLNDEFLYTMSLIMLNFDMEPSNPTSYATLFFKASGRGDVWFGGFHKLADFGYSFGFQFFCGEKRLAVRL